MKTKIINFQKNLIENVADQRKIPEIFKSFWLR